MTPEQPNDSSEQETPFSANVTSGLSLEEIAKRWQQHGPNEIPEKKVSLFRKLTGCFWGPIPSVTEIAAAPFILIQHYDDFAIIFMLPIVNATVGFRQGHKAENSIERLRNGAYASKWNSRLKLIDIQPHSEIRVQGRKGGRS